MPASPLAQSLSPDGAANKSIFRAVMRATNLLIAAINRAADGQGDIEPVEAMLDGARTLGQFFVTAVERDSATLKPPSSTCWRPPSGGRWKTNQSQKMDMVGQLAGASHDFNTCFPPS
jgi:two-component system cell cycle sensor histidine kinase/response regulator CckA